MSESFPDSARQAIKLARQALREGRRSEAIQHAKLAAELAPEMEEPLLILGALSDPAESIEYLRKALAVNPSSEAARKGMHWAVQRLRAQTAVVLPAKPEQETKESIPAPEPEPQVDHTQPTHLSSPDAIPPIRVKKKSKKSARTWLLPLVSGILIFCIGTLAWLAIPALQSSTAKEPYAVRPVGALFKPSLTPTVTPTPTPTNTPTPTPTATPTATPTDTPTPTPTDTPPPPPTDTPVVADMPDGIAGEEAWIDVDLTNQMVYALVGDEIVNSFLVSTGTWQHPTVTGEYNIYVKYRYTDMAGPGYYLPDVPYTMYFYQGYGLHGTYWHNNFGTPMSHGCVNLRTEDAAWLFDFASVGTLVNVHY